MSDALEPAAHPARPSRLFQLVLTATVVELVLLGSGRPLQFGPLTGRMLLFALGVGLAALQALHRRRIDGEVAALVLAFLVVLVFGAEVGLLSGATLPQVVEDMKPLLFFLGVLFFAAAITSTADVRRVAAAIQWGAIALAVGYLGLLVAVVTRVIPFGPIYAALTESGEVFFRGQAGFFYKGFLYLGVGIFFFAFGRGSRGKIAAGVLLLALVLTLTRGLLLATGAVLAAALVIRQRNVLAAVAYVGGLAAAAAVALPFAATAFANRAGADAIRLNDARQVVEETTWSSVLVGHGLGVPIGSRDRIEATYLEILFQQGLLGLSLWGLVFALIVRDYVGARRAGRADLAEPFFLGALFVYLESATNPFLTNPIGMSMVLLSLVSLRVLARGDAPDPRALTAARP